MPTLNYIIADSAELFDAHSAFTIHTLPVEHSLCGAIAYSATFDGAAVDDDPLSYNPSAR